MITTSGSDVLYNGTPIGTFTGGVGTTPLVVALNAQATAGKAGVLLRNIVYRAASQNPASNNRTVWVRVTDGDGGTGLPVTKTLTITPVNDVPVLAGFAAAPVGYVRNAGAPVILAPSTTVTDVDSANFDTGKLTVEVTSGLDAGNQLSIGGTLFSVVGTDVKRNGVTIGTLTSNGLGTNRLEITFNASALTGYVQQLVRAIRFKTVGSALTDDRVVSFTLTDGDGGTSATLTKTVDVT